MQTDGPRNGKHQHQPQRFGLAAKDGSFRNTNGNGAGIDGRRGTAQAHQERRTLGGIDRISRVHDVSRSASAVVRVGSIDGSGDGVVKEQLRRGLGGDVAGGVEHADLHMDMSRPSAVPARIDRCETRFAIGVRVLVPAQEVLARKIRATVVRSRPDIGIDSLSIAMPDVDLRVRNRRAGSTAVGTDSDVQFEWQSALHSG